MAEGFRASIISSGNWWDSSSRNSDQQFDSGSSSSTSTTSLGSFGWPSTTTDMVVMNKSARSSSCMDSISVSCYPPAVLHQDQSHSNLQMMGLGLCSPAAADWNQGSLIRGGKLESNYHAMIEEDHLTLSSNPKFGQQEVQWRGKVFLPPIPMQGEDCSTTNQVGFSIDHQPQFSSLTEDNTPVTCKGLSCHFPVDNSSSSPSIYGENPSNILVHHEGMFGSNNNNQPALFDNRPYDHPLVPNYGLVPSNTNSLPNKLAEFLRNSSSKVLPTNHPQFQYSHSASSVVVPGVSSGFLPPLQTPPVLPRSTFDDKAKQNTKSRNSTAQSIAKKSGSETTTKRPRSETQSTLPPFKVRKEKMGDRVTALQQLVSPFGKTDTASVLSEAIEYIKFLHEQVSLGFKHALREKWSTHASPPPGYFLPAIHKLNGFSSSASWNYDKARSDHEAGPNNKDLRSRGLCLVPVSSTFPVTHETTVDFWTPTFGGSFR